MKVLNAELFCVSKNKLGESPVWVEQQQALYWIDLTAATLNCVKNNQHKIFDLDDPISGFAQSENGNFICATHNGFSELSFTNGKPQQKLIVDLFGNKANFRMNDAALDRQGRFWAGSLQMAEVDAAQPTGHVYCLARQHASAKLSGFKVQNGLAWSPDGKTMYVSDSHPAVASIWKYDFDIETGIPSNKRLFATDKKLGGRPDGATVDTDGCYWIAASDSGKILRLTPDGNIDAIINVPTRNVTNICFGGANLSTLYITTQIYKYPNENAGNLFAVNTSWQGIKETGYQG
ncbi:MAG: SMP-30/gluconolactonase/LRE family protein [Alphaproteobacteria bacterium]|nr:SMP-30/gluconolactonase/LRE family protein [Alphaproteobacteria bacterium]